MDWTLDTAAEVNVIGGEDLKKFGKVSVKSDHTRLRASDGSRLEHGGMVKVHLRRGARTEAATAHIVKGAKSLLGIQGLMQLGFLPHDWLDSTAPVAVLSLGDSSQQVKVLGAMSSHSEETVKARFFQESSQMTAW